MNRWMRGLLGFSVCLILGVSQAYAVALGKIEVASHLGEGFFAEVPLQLEKNESIASVFVEVAAPVDYRILEVYHDPALNAIRSDVKKDSRGTRVELSSDSVINAPFFNLILKVRQGHATLFKKYPVFLDLPQARPVQVKALPMVSAINPQADVKQEAQPETPVSAVSAAESATQNSTKPAFQSFDGWARTGRYGPMVYGDTISTVARRLRVDKRYTLPQVMMALFNKNKKKFSQGNVNLINAGTYLDVPQASDVEEMTPAQASTLLAQQNRSWNALKKQPRYAAVAEAQKNRYKTRVRVGKSANGVASAPVPGQETKEKPEIDNGKAAETEASKATTAPETATSGAVQQTKLDTLQQGNAALQEKLKVAEDKIDALSSKLASADVVAANARIKKLELSLARLQAELDRSRQETKHGAGTPQWLTYLLSGLVVLLLGGVGYLLRRERPHPAVASTAASAAVADSSLSSLEDEVQEFEEVTQEGAAAAPDSSKEPGQATTQMNTQEFEDAFTDSIPDLTESDTAEMEALQEAVEEEPDPNVDYMAEAGVYLRYGMEDEAIGQIRMAIKQRPNNADAYVKLVQTLQSKGDQEALDAAVEAGRAALSGEGLQTFEVTVSTAGEAKPEVDLGDTLPPTGIEAIDFSGTGEPEQEKSTEDQDTLILGQEIDVDEGESSEGQSERTEENTLTEEVVLPDETTIGREEAATSSEESATGGEVAEQKETEEEENILEMGDLEMEDLDWDTQSADGEEEVQETVVESAQGEPTESLDTTEPGSDSGEVVEPPVATSEADSVEEVGTHEEEVPVPDLDLSGIDIPDVSDIAGGAASADVETSDLDKTIAIDWSGETEALEEATGGFSVETEESENEQPSGEGEAATGEEPDSVQKEEKEQPVEQSFNPQASGVLDIGLDEVEVNEAEPPSSDDVDEFTSTVRMTVDTDKAGEFPDIGLESVELEAPVESGEVAGELHGTPENVEAETLDSGIGDGDITHELDGLLTELDLDAEVTLDMDTSPDSLNIDKARSLLAEGTLDEAESSFKAAVDAGDKRGDGLLGLAEVAQQRGDADKAAELLAEAEALVDDSNREWFESIKSKQD
ncbi:MAG: FimV/HubP family polar landmark protein [Mariprofundaceae bacterium]|nr:FimV/HubP family polar landmark protein [Mariprofundaceae bacterium]